MCEDTLVFGDKFVTSGDRMGDNHFVKGMPVLLYFEFVRSRPESLRFTVFL